MSAGRVLAAFVHVQDEDGQPVVLAPGAKVPAKYADQVTNPAAFVDVIVEVEEPAAAPATPAPAPAPAPAPEAAPEPAPEAETPAPAPVPAPAAEAPEAPEAETPAPAPEAETVVERPEPAPNTGTDYNAIEFPDLQQLAKSRGLSGAGSKGTLVARLEADDRDAANQ